MLYPPDRGGYGLDAQWSDDFHHAVHAFLTGERAGYYVDFGEAEHLAKAFERPFVYAWDYSPFRGRKHGAPPEGLAGDRFVVCLQNHDQVGNRAPGDRLNTLLGLAGRKQRLAAGLLLLSPYLPLLFMGEEYGEENPFPFFCSFGDPELVEAVREGRKKEFEAFAWQGEVPDPQAEETFASAKLSWSWPEGTPRAGLRRLYRDLLRGASRVAGPARLREAVGSAPAGRRKRPGAGAGPRRRGGGRVGPGLLQPRRPACPATRRRRRRDGDPVPLGGGGLRRQPRSRAVDELAPFEYVVFGPPSWRAFPIEKGSSRDGRPGGLRPIANPDRPSSRPGERRRIAWHSLRQLGLHTGDDEMRVWPGHPYPLGATWDGAGVNFALFSENATKVELCLFDSAGRDRRRRSGSR